MIVLGLLLLAVCSALVLAWILDRRASQLHEALTLRDEFLSLAAHELKTPLTVLQLVTQRLVVAVTRPSRALSPEKQEKLAATLTRHVRRLNSLLEAMFEVAQFEAEGLTLEREPVELLRGGARGAPPAPDGDHLAQSADLGRGAREHRSACGIAPGSSRW